MYYWRDQRHLLHPLVASIALYQVVLAIYVPSAAHHGNLGQLYI
jgi:hypothetical protein